MNPFKAYDIRGTYGAEIDDTLAFRVGRAFARFTGGVDLLGGSDARTHSAELLRAFGAGAAGAGSTLHDAGCTSTPALHYLQMQRGYGAGVMATASHNPPQYHGFKLYDGSGGSVGYAKGLREIEAAVAADVVCRRPRRPRCRHCRRRSWTPTWNSPPPTYGRRCVA